MPVTPQDKPLETLRNETIDRLVMNYGHGHLSLEAFERRIDEAIAATGHDALLALTEDLDLTVDASFIEKKKRELGFGDGSAHGEDVEHMVDIFSGGERAGTWIVPAELRVFTLFGGSDIDFSDARFTTARTHVKLVCIFGGVDIFVRDGVNTIVKTFSVFGGISNKAPACEDPTAPTLVIEGLVLFGAADIRIRKTLKERLLEFAGSVRSMFGQSASR